MTIDSDTVLRPEALRSALREAKTLFDQRWLERERKKRPRDPAHLDPQRLLRTRGQIRHAIKHGLPEDAVHPVAEALLVAERSLAELNRKQPTAGSKLFYRVLSLADVARFRSILGVEGRIGRLTGPDWKSVLYELVTACSYSASGLTPELIEETTSPTPDLRLSTNPPSYVECKARLQYEREVIAFSNLWMREALLPIKQITAEMPESVVVRVVVHSPQPAEVYRSEIPKTVRDMVASGRSDAEASQRFAINVERRPAKRERLPAPVPFNRDLWKMAVDFDEWDEWHYPSEDGEFAFLNSDPRFVTALGKAVVVCARAEYLKDNRISLLNTLKDACSRQLELHKPGLIHVLIDTQLFGLGRLRDPATIAPLLAPELRKVLNEYSRLWRVVVDLISEPHEGLLAVSAQRFIATNGAVPQPQGYVEPRPVLIV